MRSAIYPITNVTLIVSKDRPQVFFTMLDPVRAKIHSHIQIALYWWAT